MASGNTLIAASCLSAFITAFCLAHYGLRSANKRTRALRLQTRVSNVRLRTLQTGFIWLAKITQKLLELGAVQAYCEKLCAALQQKGIQASNAGVLSFLLVGSALLVVICALLGRFILGFLAVVIVLMVFGAQATRIQEAYMQNMRDALPDALLAMSSCFGAGFTLLQTFSHLEEELPKPLAGVFGAAASALKTGWAPSSALMRLHQEGGIDELAFVSTALAIQHQTGGSMQHVLSAAHDSLKEELELRQSLQVHTAQAKLSARVVVGVTIGLVAAMMLISQDFLNPFFESFAGIVMLIVAVCMQAGGIVLVRQLLKVDLV